MKASHYNIFVEDGDTIVAANLLSRTVMTLSRQAYSACVSSDIKGNGIDSIDEDLLHELRQGMFLIDDDIDELAYLKQRVEHARADKSELIAVIAPTMGCNFNCHYCFERKDDLSLSQSVLDAIINAVASRLQDCKSLTVQWFGGEPLRELDSMERLSRQFIEVAKQASVDYNADVITNGYLLSRKVASLLNDLHVRKAQVTLDGDEELHNRVRRADSTEGSYSTILDNIRTASEFFAIQVRVHVAPYNLDSVHRLIIDLGRRGMAKYISELYFAPIFNYSPQADQNLFIADDRAFYTAETFARAEVQLLEKAREVGLPLPDILDEPFSVCTAVRNNSIVIDPSGDLHKCYFDLEKPELAIGDVWQGITKQERVERWLEFELPRDDECADCQFLPVCFGGCSKKWHNGASKAVICNPLRFNAKELLPIVYG